LTRVALDPYYARAERELHVTQIEACDVPRTGLVFARMLRELGHAAERARLRGAGLPGQRVLRERLSSTARSRRCSIRTCATPSARAR
jgi:hypothetical protein